ncbi:MAG: type II secretion system protein GspM [Pseudomonadota bacterium]|nr:type II secretion system protein GspM [Pseudomonadota bacterium]
MRQSIQQLKSQVQEPVMRYWQSREPRERTMLALLVGVVVVLLLWVVISSILGFKQTQAERASKSKADLQWMQANINLVAALPESAGVEAGVDSSSLRMRANQLMRQYQISAARTQPVGNSGLVLDFQTVEFDAFWRWLSAFKQQGVTVRTLNINPTGQSGLVTARLEVQIAE